MPIKTLPSSLRILLLLPQQAAALPRGPCAWSCRILLPRPSAALHFGCTDTHYIHLQYFKSVGDDAQQSQRAQPQHDAQPVAMPAAPAARGPPLQPPPPAAAARMLPPRAALLLLLLLRRHQLPPALHILAHQRLDVSPLLGGQKLRARRRQRGGAASSAVVCRVWGTGWSSAPRTPRTSLPPVAPLSLSTLLTAFLAAHLRAGRSRVGKGGMGRARCHGPAPPGAGALPPVPVQSAAQQAPASHAPWEGRGAWAGIPGRRRHGRRRRRHAPTRVRHPLPRCPSLELLLGDLLLLKQRVQQALHILGHSLPGGAVCMCWQREGGSRGQGSTRPGGTKDGS